MSVNENALQSILVEMDTQLKQNSASLQIVSAQISQKEATERLLKATVKEIESSAPGSHVWEGVGKVFIQTPVAEYTDKLNKDEESNKDQLKALNIKRDYLKLSVEKTAKSMQAILTGKPE